MLVSDIWTEGDESVVPETWDDVDVGDMKVDDFGNVMSRESRKSLAAVGAGSI